MFLSRIFASPSQGSAWPGCRAGLFFLLPLSILFCLIWVFVIAQIGYSVKLQGENGEAPEGYSYYSWGSSDDGGGYDDEPFALKGPVDWSDPEESS